MPRPGAYALLVDEQGRVAIVRESGAYFLPGGGIEPGETPEEALRREVREECGFEIEILRKLGQADEYVYSTAEERAYLKCGVFYFARRGESPDGPTTDPPELAWLEPERAIEQLSPGCHAWVIRQVMGRIQE